ncbi:hypothetical protein HPP92_028395 [Vanilla planifolia]|uniref:Uncharacterized protein n=1 Tax=Vanilla planifolia TaxID=51239 RepID=A0A835P5S4_VANPL|nr:hypothetical protein HPP92_028395 [Vanilla planifolia]
MQAFEKSREDIRVKCRGRILKQRRKNSEAWKSNLKLEEDGRFLRKISQVRTRIVLRKVVRKGIDLSRAPLAAENHTQCTQVKACLDNALRRPIRRFLSAKQLVLETRKPTAGTLKRSPSDPGTTSAGWRVHSSLYQFELSDVHELLHHVTECPRCSFARARDEVSLVAGPRRWIKWVSDDRWNLRVGSSGMRAKCYGGWRREGPWDELGGEGLHRGIAR